MGIRATLNNMGISNDKIGYDEANKTVTLNGKAFMKPSYIDEDAGISYAPEAEIQRSLTSFYKNSSNPIVRVSDQYAADAGRYGLGADALTYGNGTVSIGGRPLRSLYIDDEGKAWAWKNDVTGLVSSYANTVGAAAPSDIAARYEREYGAKLDSVLNGLLNRKEFSYNPDRDPVYQAYKNKYLTEGDRATRNAMADYAALTGGYTNSAGVTAGALASQYYAGQLSNVIPTLAKQAYERYYNDYNMDFKLADTIMSAYKNAYDIAESARESTINGANSSASSAIARDDAEAERRRAENEQYWENLFNNQEYDTNETERYWADQMYPLKLEQSILNNQSTAYDNRIDSIYLEYYRRLLEEEVSNKRLDNKKQSLEITKFLSEMGY